MPRLECRLLGGEGVSEPRDLPSTVKCVHEKPTDGARDSHGGGLGIFYSLVSAISHGVFGMTNIKILVRKDTLMCMVVGALAAFSVVPACHRPVHQHGEAA
jgi:hypothetical protein